MLEQNFRTLGSADDASWAFRRRRRMGKRLHLQRARSAFKERNAWGALRVVGQFEKRFGICSQLVQEFSLSWLTLLFRSET